MKTSPFASCSAIDSDIVNSLSCEVQNDDVMVDEENGLLPATVVQTRAAVIGTTRRPSAGSLCRSLVYLIFCVLLAFLIIFFVIVTHAVFVLVSYVTVFFGYQLFAPLWNWLIDFISSEIRDLGIDAVDISKSLSIMYFRVDNINELSVSMWIAYFFMFCIFCFDTANMAYILFCSFWNPIFLIIMHYVRTRRGKVASNRSELPQKFAKY